MQVHSKDFNLKILTYFSLKGEQDENSLHAKYNSTHEIRKLASANWMITVLNRIQFGGDLPPTKTIVFYDVAR